MVTFSLRKSLLAPFKWRLAVNKIGGGYFKENVMPTMKYSLVAVFTWNTYFIKQSLSCNKFPPECYKNLLTRAVL